MEAACQQGRHGRRVDLADPGLGQHHRAGRRAAPDRSRRRRSRPAAPARDRRAVRSAPAGWRRSDRSATLSPCSLLLRSGVAAARFTAPRCQRYCYGASRSETQRPGSGAPMARQIAGIDHVIVGVRDFEQAKATYQRLGFQATPRGRHVGWGTANYCLMFPNDYLELLGIVDAAPVHQRPGPLPRRARRASFAGAAQHRSRGHPRGLAGGGAGAGRDRGARPPARARRRAAFRQRHAGARRDRRRCRLFACAPLTPDAMRRPDWLRACQRRARHRLGDRRGRRPGHAFYDPMAPGVRQHLPDRDRRHARGAHRQAACSCSSPRTIST